MRTTTLIASAAAVLLGVAAFAQTSPPPRQGAVLGAEAAQAIIRGCVVHAGAKRQSHAVVVVDAGGGEIAGLRMDGNNRGIMDFARAKAEAVAAWQFSTSAMATSARDTPGFASAPHVVTVAGGVPIFSADGKTFLGAAGASGEAPADDEACVTAGVEGAGFRIRHG
jgi:uncharacterized protein GlcG (DUF336 family)